MSKLLEGKTAIVLGVWNKWSIAYAIAQAFAREGATLLLTYQNERAKPDAWKTWAKNSRRGGPLSLRRAAAVRY